jgi:hypothetical protein
MMDKPLKTEHEENPSNRSGATEETSIGSYADVIPQTTFRV